MILLSAHGACLELRGALLAHAQVATRGRHVRARRILAHDALGRCGRGRDDGYRSRRCGLRLCGPRLCGPPTRALEACLARRKVVCQTLLARPVAGAHFWRWSAGSRHRPFALETRYVAFEIGLATLLTLPVTRAFIQKETHGAKKEYQLFPQWIVSTRFLPRSRRNSTTTGACWSGDALNGKVLDADLGQRPLLVASRVAHCKKLIKF